MVDLFVKTIGLLQKSSMFFLIHQRYFFRVVLVQDVLPFGNIWCSTNLPSLKTALRVWITPLKSQQMVNFSAFPLERSSFVAWIIAEGGTVISDKDKENPSFDHTTCNMVRTRSRTIFSSFSRPPKTSTLVALNLHPLLCTH